MPERPHLFFRKPEPVERHKGTSGPGKIKTPDRARQKSRLSPRFERLRKLFEDDGVELADDTSGIAPEQVVVFEVSGSVADFIKSVEKSEIEWLGEVDLEDAEPNEDFHESKKGEMRTDRTVPRKLYAVLTNQEKINDILKLWETYTNGDEFERGFTKWRYMFEQLRDVRRWGIQDRLEDTGILEDWEFRLEHGLDEVKAEILLWSRSDESKRREAEARITRLVEDAGGSVLTTCDIPQIEYHALLAKLPASLAEQLVAEDYVDLVRAADIMYFTTVAQVAAPIELVEAGEAIETVVGDLPSPDLEAQIAILDGLPLGNHALLSDRIIIDDPDDHAQFYGLKERVHGTAMASLVVHGDLNAQRDSQPRRVYVRPLLKPEYDFHHNLFETAPDDRLLVDTVHRAIQRLFEGDDHTPAVAPAVKVINFSIGDLDRPYLREASPLARLLDWLSYKYEVLFIVSAGNHFPGQIRLQSDEPSVDVVKTLVEDRMNRRLLSPAEGVNVLTVGAAHIDHADSMPVQHVDLLAAAEGFPSPASAVGPGYGRCIKPDVLAPGGRFVYRPLRMSESKRVANPYPGAKAPGTLSACPSPNPGETNRVTYSRGTSNAAALASHCAGHLLGRIEEFKSEPGGDILDDIRTDVLLRALIVHSASWGSAEATFDGFADKARARKLLKLHFMGNGCLDPSRMFFSDDHRATLIGGGTIEPDSGTEYTLPLPPALSAKNVKRRLTITLAWCTPIVSAHRGYRAVKLFTRPPKDSHLTLKRVHGQYQAAMRGTLQHEILEGSNADPFVDGDELQVVVSAYDGLAEQVPYALVVSLEVAPELGLPIYNEIRSRVLAPVKIKPKPSM